MQVQPESCIIGLFEVPSKQVLVVTSLCHMSLPYNEPLRIGVLVIANPTTQKELA